VVVVLLGLLSLVGSFAYWRLHSPKPIADVPAVDASAPANVESSALSETSVVPSDVAPSPVSPESNATPIAEPVKPAPAVTSAGTEPTAETQQLVSTLSQLDLTHGPITAEQAAAWKETLNQLAAQGQNAVPAIREFLEKYVDINFEAVEGGGNLGFSSLRLALLDTLQKIGGPAAETLMLEMLQNTFEPTEIAVLANYLEKDHPQQYREAAVAAARAALAFAMTDKWDGRDVAPLFDLLKNYVGANAIPDFEKYANTWFNYTPVVLAQLPDGAGVPALIRLARGADGSASLGRDIAQRMLAQVSWEAPEAANALVEQALADRIRASAWPGVASALTGSTLELTRSALDPTRSLAGGQRQGGFHIAMGNQNYMQNPPPADMTLVEINGRIQLIQTLLGTTSNPAAIESLQKSLNTLKTRLTPAN